MPSLPDGKMSALKAHIGSGNHINPTQGNVTSGAASLTVHQRNLDTSDINGPAFKKRYIKKVSYGLQTQDITSKAHSARRHLYKATRNPLNPQYKLPSYEVQEAPARPVFIRDSIPVADIAGSKPYVRVNHIKTRDHINKKPLPKHTRKLQHTRPSFQLMSRDITHPHDVWTSSRHTNPNEPVYEVPRSTQASIWNYGKQPGQGTYTIGPVPGSKPKKLPQQSHVSNDVSDIAGARPGNSSRMLQTQRRTNPTNPMYWAGREAKEDRPIIEALRQSRQLDLQQRRKNANKHKKKQRPQSAAVLRSTKLTPTKPKTVKLSTAQPTTIEAQQAHITTTTTTTSSAAAATTTAAVGKKRPVRPASAFVRREAVAAQIDDKTPAETQAAAAAAAALKLTPEYWNSQKQQQQQQQQQAVGVVSEVPRRRVQNKPRPSSAYSATLRAAASQNTWMSETSQRLGFGSSNATSGAKKVRPMSARLDTGVYTTAVSTRGLYVPSKAPLEKYSRLGRADTEYDARRRDRLSVTQWKVPSKQAHKLSRSMRHTAKAADVAAVKALDTFKFSYHAMRKRYT